MQPEMHHNGIMESIYVNVYANPTHYAEAVHLVSGLEVGRPLWFYNNFSLHLLL